MSRGKRIENTLLGILSASLNVLISKAHRVEASAFHLCAITIWVCADSANLLDYKWGIDRV